MKRVLILIIILLASNIAFADSCGTGLMPAFTANQATQLCDTFADTPTLVDPTVEGNLTFSDAAASIVGGATSLTVGSAGSTIIKPDADANRLFTFDASSDTAHTLTYGDAGVTALQTLVIASSTADTDDDGLTVVCGGGAESSARGGCIRLRGEEFTGGGDIFITAGDSDAVNVLSGSTTAGSFDTTGLVMATTGLTLAVDSGTAASACKGTATANGTTAVTVTTTCAATGANIIIARTSAPSGTADCWTDTISNGVSFNLDCNGAETGTFSWWILKEG